MVNRRQQDPFLIRGFFHFILLFASFLHAQKPLDKSEKLAQKIRIAALEATQNIHASSISVDSLSVHLHDTLWILIDVREDSEIAISQLPRALSPAQFAARFRSTGLPKNATLVAYCTIGYRSGKFVEQLNAQKIPAVYLEGGILAWIDKGHGIVTKTPDGSFQPTLTVHVYSKEWNLLPPGYVPKW